MVADKREFIRLDVNYLDNPKVADALEASPMAVVLHVEGMCFSRRNRTDGVVPIERLARKIGAAKADIDALLAHGLLDRLDDGRVAVHDYLQHQESAEQIARLSEAGRKGAAARHAKKATTDRSADRTTDRSADRSAEERRGEESKPATQASAENGQSTASPDNAMAILASLGLITADLRRQYLAHLKERSIEHPTRFIRSMYGKGELRGDVEDWLADRDAANIVALRQPTHHYLTREHVSGCTVCQTKLGGPDAWEEALS